MKPDKEYCRMVEQIATVAAKEIGIRKKFKILWFNAPQINKMNLLMGLTEGSRLLGLNFYKMTGDRIIALDPDYCGETTLKKVIQLIAHEIVHFKITGHGKDFKALEKKALKPFKYYLK